MRGLEAHIFAEALQADEGAAAPNLMMMGIFRPG